MDKSNENANENVIVDTVELWAVGGDTSLAPSLRAFENCRQRIRQIIEQLDADPRDRMLIDELRKDFDQFGILTLAVAIDTARTAVEDSELSSTITH